MDRRKEALGKRSILITNSLPQFEYKCKYSVLFEFNSTLTEDGLTPISVGTFHNWLKQHCSYIGICPLMSDYCDKCKEFEDHQI